MDVVRILKLLATGIVAILFVASTWIADVISPLPANQVWNSALLAGFARTPPAQPLGQTWVTQPPGHEYTPQPPGLTCTATPPGEFYTPQPPGHTYTPQPDRNRVSWTATAPTATQVLSPTATQTPHPTATLALQPTDAGNEADLGATGVATSTSSLLFPGKDDMWREMEELLREREGLSEQALVLEDALAKKSAALALAEQSLSQLQMDLTNPALPEAEKGRLVRQIEDKLAEIADLKAELQILDEYLRIERIKRDNVTDQTFLLMQLMLSKELLEEHQLLRWTIFLGSLGILTSIWREQIVSVSQKLGRGLGRVFRRTGRQREETVPDEPTPPVT